MRGALYREGSLHFFLFHEAPMTALNWEQARPEVRENIHGPNPTQAACDI